MYSKQKETNSETRAWKHNQYSSFCFSLTDFATATINLAFVCHDKLSLLFFFYQTALVDQKIKHSESLVTRAGLEGSVAIGSHVSSPF